MHTVMDVVTVIAMVDMVIATKTMVTATTTMVTATRGRDRRKTDRHLTTTIHIKELS